MTEHAFRRAVRAEGYLADPESLEAYSYDASGGKGRPRLVLKPRDEEELRRILVTANQYRVEIVPRGTGVGIRGGAVREEGVVVDLRHFSRIERLDRQRNTVDVGAGATLSQLNEALAKHSLSFPLVPENPLATLGGLAARNQVTEASQLHGDWTELVERLECFDGLGRFQTLKGEDVTKVVGWEGTTGIITKLRLKVMPLTKRTMEITPLMEGSDLAAEAERLADSPKLAMLEYLDGRCAALTGAGDTACIVAVYEDDTGSYKDQAKIAEILDRRRRLPFLLWQAGLPFPEEATLEEGQIGGFIARCAKEGLPCYGHLDLGILVGQLATRKQAEAFRSQIVALGAIPAGKYGYGRTKKGFVPAELRKKALWLKEERDYNHILNPGVLL